MVEGFFITGTDTGVGKTIVAASMVAALRARGVKACGAKPVESGCVRDTSGEFQPADGLLMQAASGGEVPLELVTPVRFEAPLAPLAAAREAGQKVDVASAMGAIRSLRKRFDLVIVEGIGGLMVPVAEGDNGAVYMVADMALDIGLPLIVVASAFLGTINHTLLTVAQARQAGLKVAGVVLSQHRPPEGTPAERTNPGMLEELLDVPLLGSFPYMEDTSPKALAQAAEDALDIDAIFEL